MSLKTRRAPVLLLLLSAASLAAQVKTPNQVFVNAVRTGDVNAVDDLLLAGFDPNAPDAQGQTPLYFAILFNNPRLIQLLLSWHADPNAPLTRPESSRASAIPLQYAAREGDMLLANMLITAGARVNDLGALGRTPLHFAVEGNRLDMMRLLIDRGADVNARDSEGASPLDDAVWRGNIDATAILIANGAHLNDADTETGATPVNEAAFRGNARLVRYLLLFHPDLTTPDRRGYSPLENAIRTTDQASALLLLDAAPKEQLSAAFLAKLADSAIGKDEPRVMEALVTRGVGVNAALPSGLTPLDAAASTGGTAVTKFLLDHSADPNLAAGSGATPLEDASLKGFDGIVKLLLARGAAVDHVNADSGSTPLYAAASFGHADVVQTLLDHGGNPNVCGNNRKTPLTVAVENGYELAAAEIRNQGGRKDCNR